MPGIEEDDVDCQLIVEPATVFSPLFEDPVITSLPYLKYKTNLPVKDGYYTLLSESGVILGLNVSIVYVCCMYGVELNPSVVVL